LVAGVTLLLVACSDDGASSPTIAVASTTTTTTTPARVDDGVLRIGMLLPESGTGASIGQPLIDAVVAAGNAINAAGGVLGRPIEIVDAEDEGDNPSTARDSIQTLIEQDVDAVVGPASSTIALATLGDLMDAGILTCSPTATALALDAFPARDLFFRTAPSDSLQAGALASEAERTGALSAAVVYLDDAYARPLADATIAALTAKGIDVADPIFFAADDTLLDEATEVKDTDAGVVIVIADAEQGTRMLSNLGEVTGVVPGDDPPRIIVNDALRRPPAPQQIADLAPDVRARIIGVSPAVSSGLPGEPSGAFAGNAFDCVNLIALAAEQAGSDDPAEIAAQMRDVSGLGLTCRDYAACLAITTAGLNVDYDGPGGNVELGPSGDPAMYSYDRWTFDAEGLDVPIPSPQRPTS
jgi:branched-chain amino acid transport system substrate-binding protein